jgi:hypothetical protein
MLTTDKLILLGCVSLLPAESGGTGVLRHRHPSASAGSGDKNRCILAKLAAAQTVSRKDLYPGGA